jgi:hypothetical protein
MYRYTSHLLSILLLAASAAGCIGTDFVADAPAVSQERIELRPAVVLLSVGEEVALTVTRYDSLGKIDTGAGGSGLVWGVSDTSIVTVSSSGRVTAKRPGEVVVAATIGTLASNTTTITVVADTTTLMRRTGVLVPGPVRGDTARGTVVLETMVNGRIRLRFGDDFRSMGGPRLEVFLAHGATVDATSLGLGKLTSTTGAQVYDVPEGIGLDDYRYAIVHCVPFNIDFGIGELR